MRHRVRFKELSRSSSHRLSLRRSLAQSLFEHGEVTSTIRKVKDVRPFAEKLITLAKKAHQGSVPARQRIVALVASLMAFSVILASDRACLNGPMHRSTRSAVSSSNLARVST